MSGRMVEPANHSSSSTPSVTVGVPVYNGGQYLAATLSALQNQRLHDIEVLVADNASTDDSRKIAEEFAGTDSRFQILPSDVNRGATWNYNRLLDVASAPLFMWNMADDVTLPNHLLACRQLLIDHPDAGLAFSRAVKINERGELVGEFDDASIDFFSASPAERVGLFLGHGLLHAAFSGLYRTEELREIGGLQPFFGQDVVLGIHMALRSPFAQSSEQTLQLRYHDGQMTKLLGSDPVKQTRIFRPDHKSPFAFPQWYLTYRVLAESLRAPVSTPQHAQVIAAITRHWILPNWRSLPFDIKRNLIRLFNGRYVGPYHTDDD